MGIKVQNMGADQYIYKWWYIVWTQWEAKYKYQYEELVHRNNGILIECNITTTDAQLNLDVYISRSNIASVVMILHSMRMPLFLCINSSYHHLYSTSHWGHHYVSPVVYVLINSHYLSLDPHYLFFDIVTSMGMPASSIYMSEIICTSSIF